MSKSLGNVIDPIDVIESITLEQLHAKLRGGILFSRPWAADQLPSISAKDISNKVEALLGNIFHRKSTLHRSGTGWESKRSCIHLTEAVIFWIILNNSTPKLTPLKERLGSISWSMNPHKCMQSSNRFVDLLIFDISVEAWVTTLNKPRNAFICRGQLSRERDRESYSRSEGKFPWWHWGVRHRCPAPNSPTIPAAGNNCRYIPATDGFKWISIQVNLSSGSWWHEGQALWCAARYSYFWKECIHAILLHSQTRIAEPRPLLSCHLLGGVYTEKGGGGGGGGEVICQAIKLFMTSETSMANYRILSNSQRYLFPKGVSISFALRLLRRATGPGPQSGH